MEQAVESMSRYVSPINPAVFPHLTIVLLCIGIFFMAWFFVYEATCISIYGLWRTLSATLGWDLRLMRNKSPLQIQVRMFDQRVTLCISIKKDKILRCRMHRLYLHLPQ
ncbi:hypothetical protein LSAT2_006544 [Lamellibrachia satsuma]|nr:hypothetical protein LSAT2_006544 [Lamellibrachia satsuma]